MRIFGPSRRRPTYVWKDEPLTEDENLLFDSSVRANTVSPLYNWVDPGRKRHSVLALQLIPQHCSVLQSINEQVSESSGDSGTTGSDGASDNEFDFIPDLTSSTTTRSSIATALLSEVLEANSISLLQSPDVLPHLTQRKVSLLSRIWTKIKRHSWSPKSAFEDTADGSETSAPEESFFVFHQDVSRDASTPSVSAGPQYLENMTGNLVSGDASRYIGEKRRRAKSLVKRRQVQAQQFDFRMRIDTRSAKRTYQDLRRLGSYRSTRSSAPTADRKAKAARLDLGSLMPECKNECHLVALRRSLLLARVDDPVSCATPRSVPTTSKAPPSTHYARRYRNRDSIMANTWWRNTGTGPTLKKIENELFDFEYRRMSAINRPI